jgi:transcription elongation factor GreB
MSRYRPPNPDGPASPYITAAGYARLKAEYEALYSVRRPEVVRALAAAAAEGDRSENAEYIYRKKELREIDRRVHYLQQRLPVLKVVQSRPAEPYRVFFGASVTLAEVETGEERSVRIVGPDEISPHSNAISMDSPLAKALMKKAEGDEVRVALPGGEAVYEIVSVHYAAG